jgi:hypothetical protein
MNAVDRGRCLAADYMTVCKSNKILNIEIIMSKYSLITLIKIRIGWIEAARKKRRQQLRTS